MRFKNLADYLDRRENPGRLSLHRLAEVAKFKIIGNGNGHNYDDFLNEEGFLILNNLSGMDFDGEVIHRGCINETGYVGNSIRIVDLLPILAIKQIEIIKNIERLDAQIKVLEIKRKSNVEKLDYLMKNNKKELTNEEFEDYQMENITGIELPEVPEVIEEDEVEFL